MFYSRCKHNAYLLKFRSIQSSRINLVGKRLLDGWNIDSINEIDSFWGISFQNFKFGITFEWCLTILCSRLNRYKVKISLKSDFSLKFVLFSLKKNYWSSFRFDAQNAPLNTPLFSCSYLIVIKRNNENENVQLLQFKQYEPYTNTVRKHIRMESEKHVTKLRHTYGLLWYE